MIGGHLGFGKGGRGCVGKRFMMMAVAVAVIVTKDENIGFDEYIGT